MPSFKLKTMTTDGKRVNERKSVNERKETEKKILTKNLQLQFLKTTSSNFKKKFRLAPFFDEIYLI